MRFHKAMATLEPQKYVIARTVWTENILVVSGRLVFRENWFIHFEMHVKMFLIELRRKYKHTEIVQTTAGN